MMPNQSDQPERIKLPSPLAGRWRGRRPGFSFTEVLFAVMVLGIGFIMIAAIFPVAIRQTQTTLEETQGTMMAKEGLAYLQSVASEQTFPVTSPGPGTPPTVMSLKDLPGLDGQYAVRGNFVSSANPRVGWVPLYSRGFELDGRPSPYAQVFMIPVQARNRSQFYTQLDQGRSLTDFDPPTGGPYANLDPKRAAVSVTYDNVKKQGQVKFTQGADIAVSGAYVVIAEGDAAGRVYQLGVLDGDTWNIAPGSDMTATDVAVTGKAAFIVGKGLADPETGKNYAGSAQDIGIYVGFIQIAPATGPI